MGLPMGAATAQFAPTHRTRAGGVDAWDRPDARIPPVTRVDSGVPLQMLTSYGDGWAQVMADNGWIGWVDGRRLISLSKQASGLHRAAHHLALAGGAAAVIGSFLPWFSYQGSSATAWDVPLRFLVAGTGDDSQVKFGGFMLVMAILVIPYVIRHRLPKLVVWVLATMATGAASMAVMRAIVPDDPPDLGAGVFMTLAGGLALHVAAAYNKVPR